MKSILANTKSWRQVSILCAVACAFAVMLLTPLKTVSPFVIRVDNTTGVVDVVPVFAGASLMPETVTRYMLDHADLPVLMRH